MTRLCILIVYVVVCLLFIATFDSMCDLCQYSTENATSYGKQFIVPFPEVNLSLSSSFEYRIYVTNPNTLSLNVMVNATGAGLASQTTRTVATKSSDYMAFNASYMMNGSGLFAQVVFLSSELDFGVHVITTEKMDGFTSLPVESWGTRYVAVTYCEQGRGKCQIVIIASQFTEIRIQIMAQDNNTISVMHTTNPQAGQDFMIYLKPWEVYQLQRTYDMTGALIHSNVSVGVLSGSAGTIVGSSSVPGAFMEFLPPERTYGTEFALFRTRGSSTGDLVLVLAIQDSTVVYMSTGQQRFSLNRLQHLTRYFSDTLVYIRSDRPIVVVKFSQSDQTVWPPALPTMSVILPVALYLPNATFIIPKMPDVTGTSQYMLVLGTTSALTCLTGLTPLDNSSLPGTNLFGRVYNVTSFSSTAEVSCNVSSGYGVYIMMSGTDVSYQFPLAYDLGVLNTPCLVSVGSPGDAIDNDCNMAIDENECNESNAETFSDCRPIISGDRDVYGKTFTFLLPDNSDNDTVSLIVSHSFSTDVNVKITTPGNLSLVSQTYTLAADDMYLNVSLPVGVLASGTKVFSDRVLHVQANAEISVTAIVVTFGGNQLSAYAVRVLPNDVLGREYFVVTFCMNKRMCRVQITAFHNDTTSVTIRLNLATTIANLNGKAYVSGESICMTLGQFQSLQLESNGDMTGTHIQSNKPIAVWVAAKLTPALRNINKDSVAEQIPPIETWGTQFLIKQIPGIYSEAVAPRCLIQSCRDIVKVVASTAQTQVSFRANISYANTTVLAKAGDFLEYQLMSDFLVMSSTKPVLVLQITQETPEMDVSISLVTPVEQYSQKDDQVFEIILGDIMQRIVIVTSPYNFQNFTIDNSALNMTYVDDLHAGYGSLAVNDFYVAIENNMSSLFGGQVYSTSKNAAYMYPLTFNMEKINKVCQVTKASPGDNIDNDCDGAIDEEPCQPDMVPQDMDNDGMVNEDCTSHYDLSSGFSSELSTSFDSLTISATSAYSAAADFTSLTFTLALASDTALVADLTAAVTSMATILDSSAATAAQPTSDGEASVTSAIMADFYLLGGSSVSAAPSNEASVASSDSAVSSSFNTPPIFTQTSNAYISSFTDILIYTDLKSTVISNKVTSGTDMPSSESANISTSIESIVISDVASSNASVLSSTGMLSSEILTHINLLSSDIGISMSTYMLFSEPATSSKMLASDISTSMNNINKLSFDISTSIILSSDITMYTNMLSSDIPNSSNMLSSLAAKSTTMFSFEPGTSSNNILSSDISSSSVVASTVLSVTGISTTVTLQSTYSQTVSFTTHGVSSTAISSTTTTTTPTAPVPVTTTTTHTAGQYCGCQCPPNILTTRLPSSQVVEMQSSIQKELGIEKAETSASKRTLISASDERRSAQTIGYFGVAIFVAVFAGIVLLDASYLAKDVLRLIKFCKKRK